MMITIGCKPKIFNKTLSLKRMIAALHCLVGPLEGGDTPFQKEKGGKTIQKRRKEEKTVTSNNSQQDDKRNFLQLDHPRKALSLSQSCHAAYTTQDSAAHDQTTRLKREKQDLC